MLQLETLVLNIINGIVLGSIYALMGSGLSLIFGITNTLNFAHGEFFMIGGYVAYFAVQLLGLNPLTSIILAAVIVFLIGAVIELGIIHPLRVKPEWETNIFIATIGLSILLQNVAQTLWGAFPYSIPSYYKGTLRLGPMLIGYDRLMASIVSIIALTFLWFFIKYTKVGKAMRAVAERKDIATLMGIDTEKIYLLTFGMGSALAAIAGAVLIPIFAVYPTVGGVPLLKAFAVVILGGLGSVKGAMFSGFILGVAEAFAVSTFGSEQKDLFVFLIIILVLVFKPSGLFGVGERR